MAYLYLSTKPSFQSLTATLDLLPTNSKLIRGIPQVTIDDDYFDLDDKYMDNYFMLLDRQSNHFQTMAKLRADFGLKIGSSTGYTSEIMEKLRWSFSFHNNIMMI